MSLAQSIGCRHITAPATIERDSADRARSCCGLGILFWYDREERRNCGTDMSGKWAHSEALVFPGEWQM